MLPSVVIVFVFALCAAAQQPPNPADLEQFRVVYEWFKLDFVWPDDESKARAFKSGQFIPENIAISGVKFYRDRLYVTVPRWRDGVPATLVSISATPSDKNASPRLEPFPSWAMNELGNCTALQFVQNVEIDKDGKLWVLDSGRVNIMGQSQAKCPPKLVVFDLDRPDSARVVRSYTFSDDVVKRDASYLADLVIDATDGGFAYISDGGDADPGIIVYNSRENTAWKVRDKRSMTADPTARNFVVNGLAVDIQQNISPLALDVSQKVVYYSPLTSRHVFSISTSVLKNANSPVSVKDLGTKLGISGAYTMDDRGVFYYGLLDGNGIAKWDSKTPFLNNQHIIAKDPERLQWPSGFCFDNVGNLWVATNRLQNYVAGTVNVNMPNYRLIRGYTSTKSYLFTPAPLGGQEDDGHMTLNNQTEQKSAGWTASATVFAVMAAAIFNIALV